MSTHSALTYFVANASAFLFQRTLLHLGGYSVTNTKNDCQLWNAVTVLCGQLDCDDGHL